MPALGNGTMQTRQKDKQKRPNYIVLSLGILAVLILGAFLLFKQLSSDSNSSDANGQSDIPTDSDQPNTKDSAATPNSDNKTSEDIHSSQVGTINIVSFDQSGGYVNVRAEVTGFATEQCVYSFEIADGKPVVREQSGSCSLISIPQSEFDRIGVYTLTVTAYSGDEKLTVSKEINVQ
jgi:hypothetical protein